MLITDLILNFRQALVELVPRLDAVGLQWRPVLAGDKWDNLTRATFDALVCEPIRMSFPEKQRDHVRLPSYTNRGGDLTGWHFIEVIAGDDNYAVCLFEGLSTTHELFDTVQWRGVPKSILRTNSESSGEVCRYLSSEWTSSRTTPLKEVRFALRSPLGDKWDDGVGSVAIQDCLNDGKFR